MLLMGSNGGSNFYKLMLKISIVLTILFLLFVPPKMNTFCYVGYLKVHAEANARNLDNPPSNTIHLFCIIRYLSQVLV
jgi:hypothetical protein